MVVDQQRFLFRMTKTVFDMLQRNKTITYYITIYKEEIATLQMNKRTTFIQLPIELTKTILRKLYRNEGNTS